MVSFERAISARVVAASVGELEVVLAMRSAMRQRHDMVEGLCLGISDWFTTNTTQTAIPPHNLSEVNLADNGSLLSSAVFS